MTEKPTRTPEQIQAQSNMRDCLEEKKPQQAASAHITDNRITKQTSNRLLRRPDAEASTGLSRSTIYEWMKRGDFPQPVKLGTRLVAWRESDISAWLETRETKVA